MDWDEAAFFDSLQLTSRLYLFSLSTFYHFILPNHHLIRENGSQSGNQRFRYVTVSQSGVVWRRPRVRAEKRAGRIGRIVMRNAIEHGDIEVVAVNE
jgi:hypothetical protein